MPYRNQPKDPPSVCFTQKVPNEFWLKILMVYHAFRSPRFLLYALRRTWCESVGARGDAAYWQNKFDDLLFEDKDPPSF